MEGTAGDPTPIVTPDVAVEIQRRMRDLVLVGLAVEDPNTKQVNIPAGTLSLDQIRKAVDLLTADIEYGNADVRYWLEVPEGLKARILSEMGAEWREGNPDAVSRERSLPPSSSLP